jgi:poly-gamma-glutamate capsule biosynthesis protein CapA/YwtB (metallophosphatase superfamily)
VRNIQFEKLRTTVPDQDWREERPTRRFAQPYGLADGFRWVRNNLLGPSAQSAAPVPSLPRCSRLNDVDPRLKLAFVGDLMPFGHAVLRPGRRLRAFLSGADVLIGNLEGCIVDVPAHRVFLGQRHSHRVIDFLESLAPRARIVLGCANNHVGDYGFTAFTESCRALEERGIAVIGRRDEASIVIAGSVCVSACTAWSNQQCRYVAMLEEVAADAPANGKMNILFPHWGHEMELFPRLQQVARTRELLARWDMIVGHHSHCPQPVACQTAGRRRQLIAYSLGDLTSGLRLEGYRHGIVLTAHVGPDRQGNWQAGEVRWCPTRVDPERQSVELAARAPRAPAPDTRRTASSRTDRSFEIRSMR